MTQSAATLAETWARRVLRGTAGSLGAAIVIAGAVPALANAAGANVPNPVGFALRSSGSALSSMFGAADSSCEPAESPSTEPSALPTEASPAPDASVSPAESPAPEASPAESPAESPAVEISPAESPSSDADCESETEASESPSPEATESEDAEEAEGGEHGKIVSTVAHCAPKGKDVLLDVEGAPANHGGYVKAAAKGESLTTPWGTFDLSTLSGAEQLCTALEAARATTSPSPEAEKVKKAKKDKPSHDKSRKGKKAAGSDEEDGEG